MGLERKRLGPRGEKSGCREEEVGGHYWEAEFGLYPILVRNSPLITLRETYLKSTISQRHPPCNTINQRTCNYSSYKRSNQG